MHIRGVGQASVNATPDLARIDIGVTNQAANAQDASAQNAAKVNAVLAQLRQVLGHSADLKTVNYNLAPNYTYPRDGGQPTLNGYIASNSVQVTTPDLSIVGKVIDSAIKAGANTIQSLQFTLKDDQPARSEALKLAAKQARSHIEAIASGLNVKTGRILAAEEGTSNVIPMQRMMAADAKMTSVEPGSLEVRATVTLEAEIVQ
jgi:hypothetical protein